ncbi:hypothetical protein FBY31_3711 [Arthrobacter sp. SLBN-100]|uniref:DUF6318 family protein n=1 Tax=Arthrobacter sp. SLBN-100 TaxID=2768450 RepID=UPI001150FC78|nr:DUF6318 family protein [Arthrobacter sp. SLBN-100]TQJ69558.1 hypothetical protein FBY31_3711 [Arthrobacter sp. SLBN-100]
MTSHNSRSSLDGIRFGVLAFVVGGSLLLAGCSGEAPADPGTSLSTAAGSTSPSATPTPTPTPSAVYKPADASGPAQNVPVPVLPEVAKTETKEGLEAFAKYWFELLSYGYETGDTEAVSAITSANCAMCERSKQVQTGWHEDGRWLAGGQVTTPVVNTSFKKASDGQYQVAVQVSQEAMSYYNADGSLDSTDPKPADAGSLMLAVFRDGAWYVNTIEPIAG